MTTHNIKNIILITFLVVLLGNSSYAQRQKKTVAKTEYELKQEVEYLFVEAEKLFIIKNYSKSTEVLNSCLKLDPKNDVVFYKLAEINNITEQFSIAAGYIVKALGLNDFNKYYYLLAVDIYTNLGDLQKVAVNYEKLLAKVPKSESYLFNLAAVYIYQKNLDKALSTYNRAEKVFGLSEDISYQRQKIYLQQNRLEDAINENVLLIQKYPDNPKYTLLLVDILSSNNRLDEAIVELNKLIVQKPDFSAARLQLADIYWKQYKYEDFLTELKIAFEDKELNLNAKINTLMKYMALLPDEHLEKSIPELANILPRAHYDDSNAYLIVGDVYSTFLEKQLIGAEDIESIKEQTIAAYAKFVSLDQSKFSVWQNLLNLELQLNLQDSLSKHAPQALELFPNQAWVYLVNGIVEQTGNNLEEAIALFNMGRKRASANKALLVIFYSYLGDSYNDLKDFQNSDNSYEAALELDPLNFTVLNNFSYYLSLRGEKLELARKMSTTLIRNNPNNNTYLDTYAWVHFNTGDYIEAKRIFTKIIESGVDQGVYYDHYGDTLYNLGEHDEAVIQWMKARELDKNIENIDQKINQRKIIQ